jgi:hypothetical protein
LQRTLPVHWMIKSVYVNWLFITFELLILLSLSHALALHFFTNAIPNDDWFQLSSESCSPDAPEPYLMGLLCPISIHGSPVTLPKFQMAPRLTFLTSSGSKKNDYWQIMGQNNNYNSTMTQPIKQRVLSLYISMRDYV